MYAAAAASEITRQDLGCPFVFSTYSASGTENPVR